MSQDMSDPDHSDALAGEYVLGTLDAGERAQARGLLGADRDFAAKVELWERRLGELHLMVEPVEPDAGIWIRIKAKLPGGRPPEPQMSAGPAPEPQMPAVPPPELDLPATPSPELDIPVMPPPEPEMSFVPAGTEPPSLDAIEARISETATALASGGTPPSTFEPVPTPAADVTPAPLSDEGLPSISNTTLMPASELTPVPAPVIEQVPETTMAQPHDVAPAVASDVGAPPPDQAAPVVEPAASALEIPAAAPAAALVPEATPAPIDGPTNEIAIAHRRLRRWRALAILMLLVVAAVVALVAAWRFAPDRVPPMLRSNELMRQLGIIAAPGAPPPRRAAPSQPQFDE